MKEMALFFIMLAQLSQCSDNDAQRRAAQEQVDVMKRQADALERIANKQCTAIP